MNRWRGEVGLTLDGQPHVMRLSLGALAGLEARLGAEGLMPLVERFENGEVRSEDLIALLFAGLEGGGWAGTEADLRKARIEGGAIGAAEAGARLLKATFTLTP